MRSLPILLCTGIAVSALWAAPATQRVLSLDDLARIQEVSDPQVSPDGNWVAYAVTTVDSANDKRAGNIWMVSWDGKQRIQLTYSPDSESHPRWSPDGRYLSFMSSRTGPAKGTQIWVLDRRGGEARQFTGVKGKISSYAWSPDSKRLALVMQDSKEPEPDPKKTPQEEQPKPIVVDRYHFKDDGSGYLHEPERERIFLYDIASQKMEPLTDQKSFDEERPTWSPDGSQIAFVSNRQKNWDRTENTDVFVTDARPNSSPRRLTSFDGPDGGKISWSPDGSTIAYTQGSEPKYTAYNLNRLAIVSVRGGDPKILTPKLDRGVSSPVFTPDGRSIDVLVEDDRSEYPARVPVAGGSAERLVGGALVAGEMSRQGDHVALLVAKDDSLPEVYALEGGSLRKLTTQNDALFAELKLGTVEDIQFHSKDGTEVHGMLTRPPSFEAGKKYPLLLRIHGGPNGQDGHAFQFERQFFAANGYAVINVNYRGSAGRGAAYGESIFADWGHKEVEDLLAGVDSVVASGVADPDRLGIGGWSYGGILTDYTIASDGRFKAAISGAGSANQISMYGVDEYVIQYDQELGPPWKSPDLWMKISYPFFKADRIHTPTLFLGGDKDFNVPLVGGEQMYQALQTLGVPTELIIYPGQHHGINRPSFVRDRLQRYVAWYDKYLKTSTASQQGMR